jgi:hypothetical protein
VSPARECATFSSASTIREVSQAPPRKRLPRHPQHRVRRPVRPDAGNIAQLAAQDAQRARYSGGILIGHDAGFHLSSGLGGFSSGEMTVNKKL